MQIEVVLGFEFKRHVGRFEIGKVRAVAHLIKRVQALGRAPALGLADFQRARQRQTEEVFIKLARLFRVAAAVGVVMQAVDLDRLGLGHVCL